jgi:coenzyme F420-reducing hydrogenase beta subunit
LSQYLQSLKITETVNNIPDVSKTIRTITRRKRKKKKKKKKKKKERTKTSFLKNKN